MKELTKDEINEGIHEAMHPKACWHESEDTDRAAITCSKCRNTFSGGAWESANPDYCSEDSPRRLLAEVEARVVREFEGQYFRAIARLSPHLGDVGDYYDAMITASAETRARAAYEVLQLSPR